MARASINVDWTYCWQVALQQSPIPLQPNNAILVLSLNNSTNYFWHHYRWK